MSSEKSSENVRKRYVQTSLFSCPGFSALQPQVPPPERVQDPAFRCEKEGCPSYGRTFGRKTEYTNHLASKAHRRERHSEAASENVKEEELGYDADNEGTTSIPPPATKKPRHQYAMTVKNKVLNAIRAEAVERGTMEGVLTAVATRFRYSKQRVSDWWRQRDSICDLLQPIARTAAVTPGQQPMQVKRRLSRLPSRRSGAFPACEQETIDKFHIARNSGTRITRLWFTTTMKMVLAATAGMAAAEAFLGSRGWLQNLCRRFNIVWRRRTNSKNKTAEERFPSIQRWLARLLRRLARNAKECTWGRWELHARWNVDQVPISIDSGGGQTYDVMGKRTVMVRGRKNASRDLARFCTCQLLVRLDGGAAYMTVLFRGTGARLSIAERRAYHPDVRVHFQKKAYYDNIECDRWVSEDLPDHLKGHSGPHLLFLDNLAGHTTDSFNDGLKQVGVKRHFFVGGCTDICQPIDAGVGNFIQHAFQRSRDAWLAIEGNSSLWFSGIGVSQLRILCTQWLAGALQELRSKPEIVLSAATRTGCAMRPHCPGEGVKLQGLEGKQVDYNDVGSSYVDNSDSDAEPGVDMGDSDSGAEDYGRGADSQDDESLVSAPSGTSSDEGYCLEDVDPTFLIPVGCEKLEAPQQLADAIGSRILVKVAAPKRRGGRFRAEEDVKDWWSGRVVCDTRSTIYTEMRRLGHTLVVEFDEVYRSCGYEGEVPAKQSFYLYLENYGNSWVLYQKLSQRA
eukprot:GHVU01187001.1.p1 GENE.GHVU01187001.1~~GHVU01187001.1.p1  ORF type:complete len:737 (-),score=61.65 GHVU01187001.1:556-2766(-)